jgi:carbonic anhydrase
MRLPQSVPLNKSPNLDRRAMLQKGLACAAAFGFTAAAPQRARAQSALNPREALAHLRDGNQRFTEHRLTSFNEDLAILRDKTLEKQEPFAAILACADSRVPVEILFDQTIGHLFVTRVAGNFATSDVIASLEYAVSVLETKLIVVLGHRNCGAVKAGIGGKTVPGQISTLYPYLRPAIVKAGTDVEEVTKENARIQADLLRHSSTEIAPLIKTKQLEVVPAYYDVATGKVTFFE